VYKSQLLIQKWPLDAGYVETSTFDLQILAFWIARLVACSLRDVSEKPALLWTVGYMEAAESPETLIQIYEIARRHDFDCYSWGIRFEC
jgi:hypothetical protein